MLKPSYKVQVGSETFEPDAGNITGVSVLLAMNGPAGIFEIVLGLSDRTLKIERGDEVSVQLGYGDSLYDVFKGFVDDIEPNISQVRVTGTNSASRLLELRVNQVYENQSAGEIVSDLAEKAKVDIEETAEGISFPMYFVDDSKNAYEHMRDLAEKCGFDVYVTGENKLAFKKYEGKDPYLLEYGKNIISIETYDWKPSFGGVIIQGEGASSYKGAETFHWFTKKHVEGIAGSGTNLLIHDPSVRDKDTAEKVAKARMESISRSVHGLVKILGNAEVKLGDTIKIDGLKDKRINREFQVRTVEHVLNKVEGFVTLIGWRV